MDFVELLSVCLMIVVDELSTDRGADSTVLIESNRAKVRGKVKEGLLGGCFILIEEVLQIWQ